ncbi:TKL family protein kinase [Histomonas meleagridis]|uniref:TKL family protein kinase n=1 Tax=Histomonas meleagridis TaxID=135588 RepID=UPI00355A6F47|nr:TKL family protein kinase [Histomonas meleagridis]KAH0796678.1 TKL family protein kinase [Histomonas meleagridis]
MKLSNRSAVYSPDLFIPKKPTVIRHSEIRLEKNIATGGFAQVWLGIYLPTGQKVAIKKLFSTELTPEILNEINIHSSLHHKFITNFIGYTDEKPFCIVTEYVPNGTLHDALHSSDSKVRLSPTDLTIIATGISSAMSYMHSKRIVHRDLKSLNILLDSRYQPKICDFGISTILDSDSKLNQGFGTASIMSPEQHRQQNFNESVDVYAFGIMLWEMLTRQVPFENIDPIQLIYSVSMKGERPPIPKNTPKLLEFLIRKCWSQTPEERPTFKWIHLELSSGNIQFPGTISSAVSNFFASYGGRTQTNSTFVFAASEPHNKPKSQIASGRRDRTFDTRMEVAEIVNALRNPHKKEFKVALHCIESDPKIRRLMDRELYPPRNAGIIFVYYLFFIFFDIFENDT